MKYENDNTKLALIVNLFLNHGELTDSQVSAKLIMDVNDVKRLLDKLILMGVVIRSNLYNDVAFYKLR